jgi:hypothetical protein
MNIAWFIGGAPARPSFGPTVSQAAGNPRAVQS